MKIKALFFDLDGTLLNDDGLLSQYSIQIIKKWINQGGKVYFATARSRERVKDFLEAVSINGLVALRGAFTYINGKLINEFCVSQDIVRICQNLCISNEDCFMSVFLEDKILTNFKPFLEHGDCEYCDFKNTDLNQVGKILFLTDKLITGDTKTLIERTCLYNRYSTGAYSIYDLQADKLNAIKLLCKREGLELDEIASFGNDDTDIEMVKSSGIGIAVRNSTRDLLEVCDEICRTNNEDGPAKWVEENLL